MNKHKFVKYLRQPAQLDPESITELTELVKANPYFQSARTLLAKASKQLKAKNANVFINSAAVYATDRALLKRYLNDELIFLNPLEVHESHEAERGRELSEAIKIQRIDAVQARSKIEEPKASPPTKEKEIKTSTTEIAKSSVDNSIADIPSAPSSSLDLIIEELYRDMEELKVSRAKLRKIEEQLTEEEAVDEAVKKATANNPTPKKGKTKKESETSSSSTKGGKPTARKKTSSATPPKASKPKSAAKPKATKAGTTKKTTARKTPSSTAKKASTQKSAQKKQEPGGDSKEDKGEPGQKHKAQEDIIANFIKNNPSITPGQVSQRITSENDMSKNSAELHPEIASEYLAEIYLEQGLIERAIQIYESLIVKNPQKSIYFADIIKKLKEDT